MSEKDTQMTPPEPLSAPPAAAHVEGRVGHVVSIPLLVGVLVALLILTWVTVLASYFDMGNLNIVIAVGIATVKASLVALYFMHLRWDRPFNAVVLVGSFLFLGIFIGLALMDTQEYRHTLEPPANPPVKQFPESGR
ncbi:MAG: cytochrome C oxidase subunit IV family protein [Planctomycetota bacterium]